MTKVNVSLPEEVLKELDKAASEANISRSALLAQAVKHFLQEQEKEREKEKRHQAAAEIDRFREEFGGWDGTAEVLRWRDQH